MAKSEHKRKLKLVKKQRRSNEIKKLRNKKQNLSHRDHILAARQAPWVGCYKSGSSGMHTLFAIRQTRNSHVACVFLVDMYCLGIKDAFFVKDFDMEAFRERQTEIGTQTVSPEYALKLIRGAIAFAQGIGFEPSAKANLCSLIFGDIDTSACTEEFVFGKDGKPVYSSGPFDSKEKQFQIMRTLEKLGEGNYHYVLGMDPADESYFDPIRVDDDELDDDELGTYDNDDEYSSDFENDDDQHKLGQPDTINALDVRPSN